jgi:predicted RNA-binding Zn ribbon-like protein
MRPLFLGNHPAIDFLNTALAPNGEPIETLGSGHAWLDWLAEAKLLDAALAQQLARRLGDKALTEAAAEARGVREWARKWLARWRARPRGDYGDEIAALNKLLERAPSFRRVELGRDGAKIVEIVHFETADALLAVVAQQIAGLITEEQPDLIRECAGADCTLWFLDRSKAHGRLFCSPTACGNRAKVAAFRARKRG